jgi:predicted O-methyltransferase YrrM
MSTVEMTEVAVESLVRLYREYADDLRAAREAQRELLATQPMRAKLDDLEAEILYLVLRESRPSRVAELGSFHGWSTSWILRALRDNGFGTLHSYDLVDAATRTVPPQLADGRWTFVLGDARTTFDGRPDFLFVDAAHTAAFARWYTGTLFDRLQPGTPVFVHDVYHGRRPWPLSEGRVVLDWLRRNGIDGCTVSRAAAPAAYAHLRQLKRKLGLAAPVHTGRDNPMVFFRR